ncbi:glycoside hydrolase family 140 protein [Paraflavisolibacter sp. H34]|uniref:glycoside hydrolase family 140 protein n=1 Tax=Huijunlia imazamoxiresistens TaxID=3127457 RepID=UPI0030167BA8
MNKKSILASLLSFSSLFSLGQQAALPKLKVSANKRFIVTEKGDPFFWLGDTGWLLFGKLSREEAEKYLEDRRQKGFNVVQVMALHTVGAVNVYGDKALHNKNVAQPATTPGNDPSDSTQYDFWDHADYIIDLAAQKGIYMGLVPVWGTNVGEGMVAEKDAKVYAAFLANRYKDRSNIIWLNGGDIKGSDSLNTWKTIGRTINQIDNNHLITFHPRGRTTSSVWFHNEPWLDFNMFQSGHRRYEQDTTKGEPFHYGEDNWKFVQHDLALKPLKPTIDGEPSYEAIPHGLHDSLEKRWTDADVRRYGYWSVFAGGFGYTYGHNDVMQMRKPTERSGAFGSLYNWYDAISHPGAGQMVHLKNLVLSKPFLERVPDQSLVAGAPGQRYDRILATRGKNYAFLYTYTGRNFSVNMGRIAGAKVKASWYDPRTGDKQAIGSFANKGVKAFNPPGEKKDGNDWVLILESL